MRHTNTPLAAAALVAAALLPAATFAQSATRTLDGRAYMDVAREVLPSVVNINVEPKLSDDENDPSVALRRFFQQRNRGIDGPFSESAVTGSGVLVDRRDNLGYVLTNAHVVNPLGDEKVISLTFHQREEGSTEYSRTTTIKGDSVRIIGTDELSDLAVLEFLMPVELDVQPLQFADSDRLEIGEPVLAVGNPLNFNHTITDGIISGKARNLGSRISLERLLQTNCVIQPGNSGGPLVNMDGRIVGINNAIISQTGLWQGTSFAIPSNDAKRIKEQLVDLGRVVRGYLGVNMEDVAFSRDRLREYQLEKLQGVLVTNIVPNSPADIAGVQRSDVITHIDGEEVLSPDHMLRIITSRPVNDSIEMTVVRLDDARKPLTVVTSAKLTERPQERLLRDLHDVRETGPIIPMIPEAEQENPGAIYGIEIQQHRSRRGDSGLLVESVDPTVYTADPQAENTLREGDLLVFVNGRRVYTIEDFQAAITWAGTKVVEVEFLREGMKYSTTLSIAEK